MRVGRTSARGKIINSLWVVDHQRSLSTLTGLLSGYNGCNCVSMFPLSLSKQVVGSNLLFTFLFPLVVGGWLLDLVIL